MNKFKIASIVTQILFGIWVMATIHILVGVTIIVFGLCRIID